MLVSGIAVLLLLLHLLLAWRTGSAGGVLPQLLTIALQLMALSLLLQRGRRSARMGRSLWRLLAAAVMMQVLWAATNLLASLLPAYAAWLQVLAVVFSALYVVPAMYLIGSAFSSREPRAVRALDLLLSVVLAVLLGVLVFAVLNGASMRGVPGQVVMVWHADLIDYTLCALVTLRLLGARSQSRRAFYFAVCSFLWVNSAVATLYNRVELQGLPWWALVLVDLPYLLLILVVTRPPPRWLRRYRPSRATAQVIAAFAPVAIALGVLTMGITISQLNFYPGALSAVLAALVYGLRVALIQTRHADQQRLSDQSNRQLQVLLGTDPLTGIANRTVFEARLRETLSRDMACSLLMIDIDHFKLFNDSQGHVAGDACLVQVAAALRSSLRRAGDVVARFGGEEFVAVLPDTLAPEAEEVAVRMLQAVDVLTLPHPQSATGHLTISIGVASRLPGDGLGNGTQLLECADLALYEAKRAGRHGYQVAMPPVGRGVA
ncbi:GGDEF domain-containing protein [Pseudoxanthomonas composti]|uniref:diguanylate cyclase n=1 Tax=Pseudoxanthomonas composti TaxID=2137479 RepID=A0A4Q1JV20_9GAMM|nr:GGDEF domain-containing protein [Pseudoxanthomonas composti]RXR05296.1 GGDEF domain-containing protein [Pseudoxanthomonas composti]